MRRRAFITLLGGAVVFTDQAHVFYETRLK
jgi:hypothetical protein